ncbi:nucleotide cyclase [Haematococcus lacustris]
MPATRQLRYGAGVLSLVLSWQLTLVSSNSDVALSMAAAKVYASEKKSGAASPDAAVVGELLSGDHGGRAVSSEDASHAKVFIVRPLLVQALPQQYQEPMSWPGVPSAGLTRMPSHSQPHRSAALGFCLLSVWCTVLAGAVAGSFWRQAAWQRGEPAPAAWKTVMPPGPGAATTLVLTDVQDSTTLYERLPADVMDVAMRLVERLVRQLLLEYSGYESSTEGDAFVCAFHTPLGATLFCLRLQEELLALKWPVALTTCPEVPSCHPVWAAPSQRFNDLAQVLTIPLPSADSPAISEEWLSPCRCAGTRQMGSWVRSMVHSVSGYLPDPPFSIGKLRSLSDTQPITHGRAGLVSRCPSLSFLPLTPTATSTVPCGTVEPAQQNFVPDTASPASSSQLARLLSAPPYQALPASFSGIPAALVRHSASMAVRLPVDRLSALPRALSTPLSSPTGNKCTALPRALSLQDSRSSPAIHFGAAGHRQALISPSPISSDPACFASRPGVSRVVPPAPTLHQLLRRALGIGSSSPAEQPGPFALAPQQSQAWAYHDPHRAADGHCQQLVFSGLRVRCGVHTGVESARDVFFNSSCARTQYRGPALALARAVCDAAQGAQVLLSQACFTALPHQQLAEVTAALTSPSFLGKKTSRSLSPTMLQRILSSSSGGPNQVRHAAIAPVASRTIMVFHVGEFELKTGLLSVDQTSPTESAPMRLVNNSGAEEPVVRHSAGVKRLRTRLTAWSGLSTDSSCPKDVSATAAGVGQVRAGQLSGAAVRCEGDPRSPVQSAERSHAPAGLSSTISASPTTMRAWPGGASGTAGADEIHNLYSLLPTSLAPRLVMLSAPRAPRVMVPGVLEAPYGHACVAFLYVVGFSELLAWDYDVASAVLEQLITLIKCSLVEYQGYLVELVDGFVLAAFPCPASALRWACSCQQQSRYLACHPATPPYLMAGESVQNPHIGAPRRQHAAPRGLSIKVGIDMGPVRCFLQPVSGVMAFRGKVMNRAARIASTATSGQVLCSAQVWQHSSQTVAQRANDESGKPPAPVVGPMEAATAPASSRLSCPALQAASCGWVALKGVPEEVELMEVRAIP